MTIENLPEDGQRYYLVSFDEKGRERTDDPDGTMSERVLDALRSELPTDVFILSHGWKGDVPAAREQYTSWMGTMLRCAGDIDRAKSRRPGFRPMFIGLHWPSLPFGDEDLGGGGVSFSGAVQDDVDALVERFVSRLVDTPAAREALRTIFSAAQNDIAPAQLPEQVRLAYLALDRELALGSQGVGGGPGDDREPFDPSTTYANVSMDPVSYGTGSIGVLLSPLVQLSFWKMKDRARSVGEGGGFSLLTAMMHATEGRDVRFHLMGHSFGCIVASAMVCGPQGARLPRPPSSLVLVQGALSLWSYCSSIPKEPGSVGYFRRLVSDGLVSGPIVTTRSDFDTAVRTLYPLAAGVAGQTTFPASSDLPKYGGIGAFGARGPGLDTVDIAMLPEREFYDFLPGRIHNIDGNALIREGGPPSGAHSDIAKPEVAHVLWEAALSP